MPSARLRAKEARAGVLTLEYKARGTRAQFAAVDEAIRTVRFIRDTCLRPWMDGRSVTANDLQAHCAVLARDAPFAATRNSRARRQAADRAGAAISRLYAACRAKTPGRRGCPRFQRHCRSVAYEARGWRPAPDGRHVTVADGHGMGRLRLAGTRTIETFPAEQIKRVRLVRRADGPHVQFALQAGRRIAHAPTVKHLGVDVGLAAFLTDPEGNAGPDPRSPRVAEPQLKRRHRRASREREGSRNRAQAGKRFAGAYLHVGRRRADHARKLAGALIHSCDWSAYEDPHIRGLARNRSLAKSVHDAHRGRFRWWGGRYARAHGIVAVAVPPRWTSRDCSGRGRRVRKSRGVRAHRCPHRGPLLDRDHNAARNILRASYEIANRTAG